MAFYKYFTFSILILFLSTGCISNLLKEPAPTFSKDIILPILPEEFILQKTSAYPSWKSKKTSNVVLVISECSDPNLNLKSAHALITSALENEKVIEEKKTTFKKNPAYYRKVSGLVDGLDIDIISTSFKYKECVYISSLSGVRESLNKNLDQWTAFNQQIEFKK
jgi:hypothetical protein